jgi:uncharacterized protein YkuJ
MRIDSVGVRRCAVKFYSSQEAFLFELSDGHRFPYSFDDSDLDSPEDVETVSEEVQCQIPPV